MLHVPPHLDMRLRGFCDWLAWMRWDSCCSSSFCTQSHGVSKHCSQGMMSRTSRTWSRSCATWNRYGLVRQQIGNSMHRPDLQSIRTTAPWNRHYVETTSTGLLDRHQHQISSPRIMPPHTCERTSSLRLRLDSTGTDSRWVAVEVCARIATRAGLHAARHS